jgi:hypothetical protein
MIEIIFTGKIDPEKKRLAEEQIPLNYPNEFRYYVHDGWAHREDGPAIEFLDGYMIWALNGNRLDPEKYTNDPEMKLKYPKLIESMIIYLVHNS